MAGTAPSKRSAKASSPERAKPVISMREAKSRRGTCSGQPAGRENKGIGESPRKARLPQTADSRSSIAGREGHGSGVSHACRWPSLTSGDGILRADRRTVMGGDEFESTSFNVQGHALPNHIEGHNKAKAIGLFEDKTNQAGERPRRDPNLISCGQQRVRGNRFICDHAPK